MRAKMNAALWRVMAVCVALAMPMFSFAQEPVRPVSMQSELGPETHLPLPRFVSLKASEANVRRGPSLSHRVDWIFQRRNMPLQVVAEYGHWRRVIDRDGLGGWVHYSLLSGNRTVLIEQDLLVLHARPEDTAPHTALLEAGVIADLGDCIRDWCRLSVDGHRGWARKDGVWGVAPNELRN